jgi:hypothetical protein
MLTALRSALSRGRSVAAPVGPCAPGRLLVVAWNDGCLPRPAVVDGARTVDFPWDAAHSLGTSLASAWAAVAGNLEARAAAVVRHLPAWAGDHRREFDGERSDHEAVLTADPLGTALATLRSAWDDAADLQAGANAATPVP